MIEPLVVEFDVDSAPAHAFDTWTSRCGLWWRRHHPARRPNPDPHRADRLDQLGEAGAPRRDRTQNASAAITTAFARSLVSLH
ncbi:MAG TPA: hypothetical protein VGR06_34715 [Actinophytocola sp.]|uniref:hypothetical protein n=1 Tax=Actinophytocola sp. TaxID=1872138 RepID=UPI002DFDB660|nr:hypothetical protein [Actinophytocola sp.]